MQKTSVEKFQFLNNNGYTLSSQVMFTKLHFPSLTSTHMWALEQIPSLSNESLFISADYQTKGIGRQNTSWHATNKENLLGTFLFPYSQKDSSQNLAQLLSFSTMTVLDTLKFDPLFKWPNDLIINEKKVGGIMVTLQDSYAVASIGLNINMQKKDLQNINPVATSLLEESNHQPYAISQIKDLLVETFIQDQKLFLEKGFEPFFETFAQRLAYKGHKVSLQNHTGSIEGLHKDGRLILRCNDHLEFFATGTLRLQ